MFKRQFTTKDYINMLLSHLKLVVILPFVFALLTFTYTVFFITPTYSSSMLVYVKNTDAASAEDSDYYRYSSNGNSSGPRVNPYSMSASAQIAGTCSLLFKTDRFMTNVLTDEELETERSYSPRTLRGATSFESVNDTQILKVSITLTNAKDTAQMLKAIYRQSENYYKDFFPTGQIFMVEEPSVPSYPTTPNVSQNVLYGFGVGLAVAVGIAALLGFADKTIKSGEDLYKIYNVPVFAEIIDIEV